MVFLIFVGMGLICFEMFGMLAGSIFGLDHDYSIYAVFGWMFFCVFVVIMTCFLFASLEEKRAKTAAKSCGCVCGRCCCKAPGTQQLPPEPEPKVKV